MNIRRSAPTVRLNTEWARAEAARAGGVAAFAEQIGTDKSTVYRNLSGRVEAGPRLIAAVMAEFGVEFGEAFDIVHMPVPARRSYEGNAA